MPPPVSLLDELPLIVLFAMVRSPPAARIATEPRVAANCAIGNADTCATGFDAEQTVPAELLFLTVMSDVVVLDDPLQQHYR